MYRVLLIEDSRDYQIIVGRTLANLDVEITNAGGVQEALNILNPDSQSKFDLIILDLGLPDGEGLTVMEHLNSNQSLSDTAVFLLTGNDDLSSKVAAFNLGAEDYLVKPVNPIELRARIEMRLRKSFDRRRIVNDIRQGPLRFEFAQMKVWIQKPEGEREVELTGKEFKILACLAKANEQVLTRADLVKEVWGSKVHVLERTVDSHICAIRRKFGESFIESVPGEGYRFSNPVK